MKPVPETIFDTDGYNGFASTMRINYDGTEKEHHCTADSKGQEKQQKRHKSILILGSSFLPRPTANGVCLINIARAYLKDGHTVFCIAAKDPGQKEYEVLDGVHIYRVERSWFTSFHEKYSSGGRSSKFFEKAVHLIRNVGMIPFYPNVAPVRARKVYSLAKKIIHEKQIDTVIASYVPYEMIYAVLRLKRKFGNRLYCVAYYLDYLRVNKYSSLARVFYDRSCAHAQKKDLRCLDRVGIPISCKDEFEKQYGMHENVVFLELPVYVKEAGAPMKELPFSKDMLNLAFVGSLNTWNRSPERLLKLLHAVQEKKSNLKLHIWGNITDTGDILTQYASIAEYHGYTESRYIPTILQKADWVVNISNERDYHLVPSKIFQLFASGKPVLNYMFNREDVSIPYFERYKNTYTVYDDQANEVAVIDALVQALKKKEPLVSADAEFRENMPEYVAKRIL